MKKLTIILLATFFICTASYGDDRDKIRKYLYTNMLNETMDCWSFYMIIIRGFELKDPKDPVIDKIKARIDTSWGLYDTFLQPLGITQDEGSKKLKRVLKSKANISDKELINKYGRICKDLTDNYKIRSQYWLSKYKSQ